MTNLCDVSGKYLRIPNPTYISSDVASATCSHVRLQPGCHYQTIWRIYPCDVRDISHWFSLSKLNLMGGVRVCEMFNIFSPRFNSCHEKRGSRTEAIDTRNITGWITAPCNAIWRALKLGSPWHVWMEPHYISTDPTRRGLNGHRCPKLTGAGEGENKTWRSLHLYWTITFTFFLRRISKMPYARKISGFS